VTSRLRAALLALLFLLSIALFALPSGAVAQDTLNCDSFATQGDAQAELELDPSDPNNLDGDGDGRACETGVGGTSTVDTSGSATADTSGSTTELASTGSDIWILGGAGLLALAGAFALRRRARA
jgi:LPXTG-motif cell wall-anchored protein